MPDKKYSIKIDAEALANIRDISGWYDLQNTGLGKRFQNAVVFLKPFWAILRLAYPVFSISIQPIGF
jgi:hypothetical protein